MAITTNPWPLLGHDMAVERLARAVQSDRVAHAYLFSGPDHIGKTTLARAFAQALLCLAGGARPCGACRACRLVQANRHPDMMTLDMAWQTMNLPTKGEAHSISVDAIRLMNNELSRRPHEGKWKVLLIPNVEEFTLSAANAFLKTLEEPPAFVIILLTTREVELVLPTIRSRCQPMPLFPLPSEQVEQGLQVRWGVEPERARLLARLGGGRIGWAIQAAQDSKVLEKRGAALDNLQQALQGNRAERLLLAASLSKADDEEVLPLWASWWRDVLMVQQGAENVIANIDQSTALEQAAQRYTPAQVQGFLRELQRLLRLAQTTNLNRQLYWEVLLLKLP
ncbi:MAG: DNA polymerase III subunit delta' [Ardenticatenales bacterium]|nr:DNA polymerase III subunit delta' [Ardenticatenales bacterium]